MSPDRSPVDSQQYRFSFAIEGFAQVPADFVCLPPSDRSTRACFCHATMRTGWAAVDTLRGFCS